MFITSNDNLKVTLAFSFKHFFVEGFFNVDGTLVRALDSAYIVKDVSGKCNLWRFEQTLLIPSKGSTCDVC